MRPKERLWQLPADTHIIDWLDAKGFVYDVITEDDLEAEGVALLAVAPRALDLAGRASACTTVRARPATRIPDRDRLRQLSLWMLRIKLTPLVTSVGRIALSLKNETVGAVEAHTQLLQRQRPT